MYILLMFSEFKEENENVTISTTLNLILNNETISSRLVWKIVFTNVTNKI